MKFDIFCKVIDNYGDAGVCLRLSRCLVQKGHTVKLICYNTQTLDKITNDSDKNLIDIQKWSDNLTFNDTDVVVLAFSCRPSDEVINNIAKSNVLTVNLEYLSAESWVEDCHGLRSFADNLNCYYFFPGFTRKTGGLIIEDEFIAKIGNKKLTDTDNTRYISLFSYKNDNLKTVLKILSKSKKHNIVTVFEGLALDNLNALLNINLKAGQSYSFENFTFNAHSMVPQPQYDDILINSDLNLVRGEDSIVRAMLTGNIFLWQIYYQEENAHIIKLNEFIDRMGEATDADPKLFDMFRKLNNMYNSNGTIDPESFNYDIFENNFKIQTQKWSEYLLNQPSLTDSLIEFCAKKI